MHKKPEADLLPLDTKIERTLRNMRKVTSFESTIMANQREKLQHIPKETEIGRPQRQMTMEDFLRHVNIVKLNGVRPEVIRL